VALVTGASRGIGAATAHHFAHHGANNINYRNKARRAEQVSAASAPMAVARSPSKRT
jgi:NAD(P)-dependent dehydrogenase (short-subunit alcohol dehydrogenase family)